MDPLNCKRCYRPSTVLLFQERPNGLNEKKKRKDDLIVKKEELMDIGKMFRQLFPQSNDRNKNGKKKKKNRIVMPIQVVLEEDDGKDKVDFQQRLLSTRLKLEKKQQKQVQYINHIQKAQPPKSNFQQRLLQAKLKYDQSSGFALSSTREESAASNTTGETAPTQLGTRAKKFKQKNRIEYRFQKQLLEAKLKQDDKIKLFKKSIQAKEQSHTLHEGLLRARLLYKERSREYNIQKLAREITEQQEVLANERLKEEQNQLELKRKVAQYNFHKRLLAARYQCDRRSKEVKLERILAEIHRANMEKRKSTSYQFQRRLLAAIIKNQQRSSEAKSNSYLNSFLQNPELIMLSKKKLDPFKYKVERRKAKFQQSLLQATLQNLKKQRVQKSQLEEEQKQIQIQASFQQTLLSFYTEFADWQNEQDAMLRNAAEKAKERSDFHRALLQEQIDLNAKRIETQTRAKLEEKAKAKFMQTQKDKMESKLKPISNFQQQMKEAYERQDEVRKELEEAGRLVEDDSAMDDYNAMLQQQKKRDSASNFDKIKQLESDNATNNIAGWMDKYKADFDKQSIQERIRQADRKRDLLWKQLEAAGKQEFHDQAETIDPKYLKWMEDQNGNKTDVMANKDNNQTLASKRRPPPKGADFLAAQTRKGAPPKLHEFQDVTSAARISAEQYAAKLKEGKQDQQAEGSVKQQEEQMQDQLIGQVLLDKFFIKEKLRVGGDRSELYKCYHVLDKDLMKYPLVIKLSHNIEQIELEHRIYGDLFSRLSEERKNLFVRAYDWVTASPLTSGRVGFVMECGLENLRGYVWRNGPYTGKQLRNAMKNVIGIVHSLHELGVVWTELKAENFIVFQDDSIKAVDLESIAAHNEYPRAYTAETYPPEFPAESLYQCLPQIPVDYKFDVWGLGLVLFEIAVGEPLFTLQKTYDVDYIKKRLSNPEGIVQEANQKMWKVDAGAKNIIRQCLAVDPNERMSCQELLQEEYFQPKPASHYQ